MFSIVKKIRFLSFPKTGFGVVAVVLSLYAEPGYANLQEGFVTRADGDNTLVIQNGLYIFRLSGTSREVAESEVRLMGQKFYEGYVARGLKDAVDMLSDVLPIYMRNSAPSLLNLFGFSRMRLGGDDDRAFVAGIAAASSLSYFDVRRVYLHPDLLHVLPALAVKLGLQKAQEGVYASIGCSSVVISDQFSENGERIIGRNQDYQGIGLYDSFPSVSFVTPSKGYRYVAVKPAGLATAGINSMNEHGLVAAIHSMFSSQYKFDGIPILTVVQRIVQYARNIDEALVMLAAMQKERGFVSGWGLHLSDRKDGVARAAVVELDGSGFSVDWRLGGKSALSNHYSTPERKKHILKFSFSTTHHSIARLHRLEKDIYEPFPRTVGDVIDIMRDRIDDFSGETLSFSPWAVSTIDQVSSSVYLPDRKEFYVAIDKAPVSDGRFMKLNFEDGFSGRYEHEKIESISFPLADGSTVQTRFPALPHFKTAFLAFEKKDFPSAYLELKRAYSKEDNPYYRIGLGFVALQLSKFSESIAWMAPLVDSERIHPHHRRVARFIRGLAYDALGERSLASEDFAIIASDSQTWPSMREAAVVRRDFPLDSAKIVNLRFSLKHLDSMAYPAGR